MKSLRRFGGDNYLETPQDLLAQYRRRSRRRIHLSIDGIEPRAKQSMSDMDKDEVQRQLLEGLVALRRRPFRGPLALRLTLGTTNKSPTHSHNIAKNLLDLFGKSRATEHSLLYADDRQVHALSVSCQHGEAVPSIFVTASPLGSLIEDMGLVTKWQQTRHDDHYEWEESESLELPQTKGSSATWEHEIEGKLHTFQNKFGWIIDPLVVPVALEVVIKPPPPSRQNGLHDLDNVLRTYLIPRVVGILKPISSYAFMFDIDEMKCKAPEFVKDFGERATRFPRPPASTKSGVSRYEAWRLPPAVEGSRGFVSVAIVTDMAGSGDIFRQIDNQLEKWEESLD